MFVENRQVLPFVPSHPTCRFSLAVQEYEKTAKEWTAKYAIPEKSAPAEESEPAEDEKLAKQGSEPAEDEKAEKGKEVKGKSPQNNKRKRKAGAAGKR